MWRQGVEYYTVKDLMVPLSEYATVRTGATLFEAVLALEKAQEDFDHTKYRHRGILVLDHGNQVIGKLNHMDVIRAIEPHEEESEDIRHLDQFGFSKKFVWELRKQRRMQSAPLKQLCRNAARLKVEDFMQAPAEGEYVDQGTSLEIAIHQLVLGNHLSLLVTREKSIVGVLRLTDVFAALFHAMKECDTTP